MTFSHMHTFQTSSSLPPPGRTWLLCALQISSISRVSLSCLVSTFIGAEHDFISYFRCIYTAFLISSYCSGAVSSSRLLSNVGMMMMMMMMILHLVSSPYGPDAPTPYKRALSVS